jgi:hypothetical protein
LTTFKSCYETVSKSLNLKNGAAKQSAGTGEGGGIFAYIKEKVEGKQ